MGVQAGLTKVRIDGQFSKNDANNFPVYFWGRINGVHDDYYIGYGLKNQENNEMPSKQFYWRLKFSSENARLLFLRLYPTSP
jgi:hypothetical protein